MLPAGTVNSAADFSAIGDAAGDGTAHKGKILPVKPTRKIRNSVVGNLGVGMEKLRAQHKSQKSFMKRMSMICVSAVDKLKSEKKTMEVSSESESNARTCTHTLALY